MKAIRTENRGIKLTSKKNPRKQPDPLFLYCAKCQRNSTTDYTFINQIKEPYVCYECL